MALMVKNSNPQRGWNQSKETSNYYKEQGQWARNCEEKINLWAKEKQKNNVDYDKTFV